VKWGYNPGSGFMRVRDNENQREVTRWIGVHQSNIGTYVTMLMEDLDIRLPEFRPAVMTENEPAAVETDSDSKEA
jgi:hypothetical protein